MYFYYFYFKTFLFFFLLSILILLLYGFTITICFCNENNVVVLIASNNNIPDFLCILILTCLKHSFVFLIVNIINTTILCVFTSTYFKQ